MKFTKVIKADEKLNINEIRNIQESIRRTKQYIDMLKEKRHYDEIEGFRIHEARLLACSETLEQLDYELEQAANYL